MTEATGWVQDEAAVETVCEELSKTGPVLFEDARPGLKGFAQEQIKKGTTNSFLFEGEKTLYGKFLPAWYQTRGVCVSMGTCRALQDTWYHLLAFMGEIGQKTELSYEVIYGGGRNIRRVNWSGDGLVGAYAAEFVSKVGFVPRKKYDIADLTQSNEALAVHWGQTGIGVPLELQQECRKVSVRAHRLRNAWEAADAIFAKKGVAYCTNRKYSNMRDKYGIAAYVGGTAHCEAARGAYLTPKNDLVIQLYRSWGENYQRGPTKIETASGPVDIPNGAYGITESEFNAGLRGGEAWAFEIEEGQGVR